MMLREVYRYEVEHHRRSATTWIYAVLLFLVTIWMFVATASSDSGVNTNSAERLAKGSILPGMFGMLATAAIFSDAAVRDFAARMDPLLFTSPLRKSDYLIGRFLAAVTMNAIVVVAIPLGLVAAVALMARFDTTETHGAFRVAALVQPFVLFTLPNMLVVGVIMFAIGMLARQVLPTYLGAIALFVAYLIAANTVGQLGSPTLDSLIDPFGLRVLESSTRYRTVSEQNTQLIGFPQILVLNRVFWLAVAAAVLALLHRRFRFAHPDGGRRRSEQAPAFSDMDTRQLGPVVVPRVAGKFELRTAARQTMAVARNALVELMATRAFMAVLAACFGLTMLWGWNVGWTLFDTATWPVTMAVVEEVLSGRVQPLLYLFLVLYAGELVWKDREVGVAEIADASPVPDGAVLLGRFLALIAMIVMWLTISMAAAILIQALQGYYKFEPSLYVRVVYGLNLPTFAIFAALAMTIHVVVNQKYVGHAIVVMAIFFPNAAPAMGIEHYLLRYRLDPGWRYSDMNQFGPFIRPIAWFKLYWASWAALLIVIATALGVRGREEDVRRRLRLMRSRFTEGRALVRAAGTAIALILLLGGFIFYNTNVLNTYRSSDDASRPQVEYEKRYGRFVGAPQLTIASADLRVEMYPEAPAVDLRGTYHLVNQTSVAIDSVHVYLDPNLDGRAFSFDRATTPVVVDTEVGYRIWKLREPIKPGDSLRLAFDVGWKRRGFTNQRMPTSIAGNGTFIDRRFLPFIGYQPVFELSNNETRKRFGLDPLPPEPGPGDAAARQHRSSVTDGDFVQVSAVLGTSGDQIAITPGVLRRTWTERGRHYFQYETEKPESFGATMFSARYAVLEDQWKNIPLRIFHHPRHAFNLRRMIRSMKASLDYYTLAYGPYPDSHLRIVEVPRYDRGGSAHPNTITFTEDNFLTRVDDNEFDMAFFGTAHEVAHTWWGGEVALAPGVRGQGLSESLANYSAMMVTEATYGFEAARRVYDYQMDRYLQRRAEMARDLPLLEVGEQPWVYYGKGAVAMYLLRDHIGKDSVDTALRRYLEKYRGGKPPFPTSLDLYAELRAVTPDSMKYLLTDLFEKVTLWDLETRDAAVERTTAGEYRVTLEVVAKKVRADIVGKETEIPMNDLVEIGAFESGDKALRAPIYLQRHRIHSGKQTIIITVPRGPSRAGIDPYRRLIDRDRDNNLVDVHRPETGR